jgi:hypothetical protein
MDNFEAICCLVGFFNDSPRSNVNDCFGAGVEVRYLFEVFGYLFHGTRITKQESAVNVRKNRFETNRFETLPHPLRYPKILPNFAHSVRPFGGIRTNTETLFKRKD